MTPLHTLIRFILGFSFWLMALLVTLILFVLCLWRQAKVMWWRRFPDRAPRSMTDGRPIHGVATIWGQTLIRMNPWWNISVEGKEHVPVDGDPVVVVANHESMADIWAMYYLGLQFRWLSKVEVKKTPIIGLVMVWSDYVFITRGDKRSHQAAMSKSLEILGKGLSMFFFPEGTRSKDGVIKPFKIGAFKMAKDADVDMLPIAIHGAGDMMRKGSLVPGRAHIKVRVLPREKGPKNGTDLQEYADRMRETIVEAHKTLVEDKTS